MSVTHSGSSYMATRIVSVPAIQEWVTSKPNQKLASSQRPSATQRS